MTVFIPSSHAAPFTNTDEWFSAYLLKVHQFGKGKKIRCRFVNSEIELSDPSNPSSSRNMTPAPAKPRLFIRCRDSLQEAAQELSVLEKAYENLSTYNSRFLVTKPLGIIPSLNALVALEVDGTRLPVFSLKSILRGEGSSISATFEDVGRWLAAFHRVMTDFHGTRSTQSFTSSLKLRFQTFLTGDYVEREFFITIDERLTREIRKISSVGEIELVFSHGDFLPRHVFVGSKTLAVIDYDSVCVAPCYYDLSYFIAYVHNSFFLLSRTHRKILSSFFERLFWCRSTSRKCSVLRKCCHHRQNGAALSTGLYSSRDFSNAPYKTLVQGTSEGGTRELFKDCTCRSKHCTSVKKVSGNLRRHIESCESDFEFLYAFVISSQLLKRPT